MSNPIDTGMCPVCRHYEWLDADTGNILPHFNDRNEYCEGGGQPPYVVTDGD